MGLLGKYSLVLANYYFWKRMPENRNNLDTRLGPLMVTVDVDVPKKP